MQHGLRKGLSLAIVSHTILSAGVILLTDNDLTLFGQTNTGHIHTAEEAIAAASTLQP